MMALTSFDKKTPLYDGETFEYRGRTFRVKFPFDDSMGEPWKEHDGHGIVSDWRRNVNGRPNKAPGERLLVTDRGSSRFYDVAATTKIAIRDGWGCRHYMTDQFNAGQLPPEHPTRRSMAACAVEQDYERMRAWCNDEWHWCGVVVILLDEDGDEEDQESLWGIDGDDQSEYLAATAYELADEIMARVEVADPDVQPSEN